MSEHSARELGDVVRLEIFGPCFREFKLGPCSCQWQSPLNNIEY